MVDVSHDEQAEIAVLASALGSRVARDEARRRITAADFGDAACEAIFTAMHRLDRHGKALDATTLHAMLMADQAPPAVRAIRLMPDIMTTMTDPANVGEHADIVRDWATRRRLHTEGVRTAQQALSPDLNPVGYAASVANRFAAIRDHGIDDIAAPTLAELMDSEDDPYDWLIPGLLERGDRLMLTGAEGLGKSTILRQIAVLTAAGLHPFRSNRTASATRAVIIDCENSERQVKRKLRPLHSQACISGADPGPRVLVECTGRLDLTRDRDLADIHHLLDAMNPDLCVIGPMYRLSPKALNDDTDAAPVLAALDTIRDRGVALLLEAHAGHGLDGHGKRNYRPRGSSALMGWPEFGYGMAGSEDGTAELVPWRGDRDERAWPKRLIRGNHMCWEDYDL
ncbi:MAG: AAA family ATPase [Nocardioidaceae bacterium]